MGCLAGRRRVSGQSSGSRDKFAIRMMLRPKPIVWGLHWTSAAAVLFLLLSSLGSGLGFTPRPFVASWIGWHLSVGVFLLTLLAIRLPISMVFRPGAFSARAMLFLSTAATCAVGVFAYQKPPIGRAARLFNVFEMPTLVRLSHSSHNMLLEFHTLLALLVLALLCIHVVLGLRALPMMLWPWRRSR